MNRKRYVQVGLGGRGDMFLFAVLERYNDHCEMVGLCDINPGRLANSIADCQERGADVPGYAAADFDKMIAETKPDCVIVTTKDCHHDEYICRAMELGCDAVSEKPMTTDAEKCRRILAAKKKTGKTLTVTFNYRYSPPRSQVKDLLMSGVIGEVLSVDFQWYLDTRHGADYFRRWHREKKNSGGLLVHKATHHFDLVNWWLSTVPESVYASGHRKFYTPETGDRLGLKNRGERCHGCAEIKHCGFALDLVANERMKRRYFDNESHDGYHRDQCVFSAKMDIEDSMNVVVNYQSGAKMSYSLNAFSPWEGYVIRFNGTKGQIEHKCQETVYINDDGSVPGALQSDGTYTRIYPTRAPAYSVELWEAKGGHGGGDEPLQDDVFAPGKNPDPYLRAADERSGAWSIMTGIAANESIATGKCVRIADLVADIPLPDYPPMPTNETPLQLGESVPEPMGV